MAQALHAGGFIFVTTSNEAPPFEEYIGNLPQQFSGWDLSTIQCIGRREYEVKANWKFLVENTCETYHTATVHKATLGPMKSSPLTHCSANWSGVSVQTDRSVVPLPDQKAPFTNFYDQTTFNMLFPSVQMNITFDCMWCMRVLPLSVDRSRVTMFFCFPQATVQQPSFSKNVLDYKLRWHLAVEEDNEIRFAMLKLAAQKLMRSGFGSENQMKGVSSTLTLPGRFAVDREPAVWRDTEQTQNSYASTFLSVCCFKS
jgi:phenylpropionate dioxygenase-like ring-hydroxylating dioxygenase large terminal subunit